MCIYTPIRVFALPDHLRRALNSKLLPILLLLLLRGRVCAAALTPLLLPAALAPLLLPPVSDGERKSSKDLRSLLGPANHGVSISFMVPSRQDSIYRPPVPRDRPPAKQHLSLPQYHVDDLKTCRAPTTTLSHTTSPLYWSGGGCGVPPKPRPRPVPSPPPARWEAVSRAGPILRGRRTLAGASIARTGWAVPTTTRRAPLLPLVGWRRVSARRWSWHNHEWK